MFLNRVIQHVTYVFLDELHNTALDESLHDTLFLLCERELLENGLKNHQTQECRYTGMVGRNLLEDTSSC